MVRDHDAMVKLAGSWHFSMADTSARRTHTAAPLSTTKQGEQVLFDTTQFRIDPTPRRAEGEYIAHARITMRLLDGGEREVHASGDLTGFDRRDDAIAYATQWAERWLAAQGCSPVV